MIKNQYKYHYTYRIRNIISNKYYIGRRSCNIHPSEDIGKKYFSSSRNNEFIIDQKTNPQDYIYEILGIFDTVSDMIDNEIYLHQKFSVKDDPYSYNMANANHKKFDFTGQKLSEKSRNKISKKHKGKKLSDCHKEKIKNSMTGLKRSEINKFNVKQSLKGKNKPEKEANRLRELSKKNSELQKQGYYKVTRIFDRKEMNVGKFTQWALSLQKIGIVTRIHDRKEMTIAQFTHWNNSLNKFKIADCRVCRIHDKKELSLRQFMNWYNKYIKIHTKSVGN